MRYENDELFDEYELEKSEPARAVVDEENSEYGVKDDGGKISFVREQLLMIVQLGICIAVVSGALILKAVGGEVYANTATWFFDNYNDTIFTSDELVPSIFRDETVIAEESLKTYSDTNAGVIAESVKKSAVPPVEKGVMTSPFGERKNGDSTEYHKGIDISADKGSNIYCVLDGTVFSAQKNESYGNYAVIDHGNGLKTLYAHCDKLLVSENDSVKAGDKIAVVGETGDAQGIHLHFEFINGSDNLDPRLLLGDVYG